jgi:hypothetical protein
MGLELGYKKMKDFYKLTISTVKKFGGAALLNFHRGSLRESLEDVYPNYKWLSWKFLQIVSAGHWENKENQRNFLENLGKELEFKCMDDWYNITWKQIKERGGSGLLNQNGGSPSKTVMRIFSEHPWNESNFYTNSKLPDGYWETKSHRINLIHRLTELLKIKDLDDWYRVSLSQINEHHKHMTIFHRYSLLELLQEAYPSNNWEVSKLQFRAERASQRWLKALVQQLFPESG